MALGRHRAASCASTPSGCGALASLRREPSRPATPGCARVPSPRWNDPITEPSTRSGASPGCATLLLARVRAHRRPRDLLSPSGDGLACSSMRRSRDPEGEAGGSRRRRRPQRDTSTIVSAPGCRFAPKRTNADAPSTIQPSGVMPARTSDPDRVREPVQVAARRLLDEAPGHRDLGLGDGPVVGHLRVDRAVGVRGSPASPSGRAAARSRRPTRCPGSTGSRTRASRTRSSRTATCPMNIVRARPVAWSIQSGGVGSSDALELRGEFDAWFAAEISPVRFQATIAQPSAAAREHARATRVPPRRTSRGERDAAREDREQQPLRSVFVNAPRLVQPLQDREPERVGVEVLVRVVRRRPEQPADGCRAAASAGDEPRSPVHQPSARPRRRRSG